MDPLALLLEGFSSALPPMRLLGFFIGATLGTVVGVIPVVPVLIAVVLGPLAETELRRALAVSEGDPMILINSP